VCGSRCAGDAGAVRSPDAARQGAVSARRAERTRAVAWAPPEHAGFAPRARPRAGAERTMAGVRPRALGADTRAGDRPADRRHGDRRNAVYRSGPVSGGTVRLRYSSLVPAKAGTQDQETERTGFPLARELADK